MLIDADNGIIAGHGRVMAAAHLQLSEVPCIRLGYLSETQKRAYVIADNKLALNAAWDDEMLKLELDELHALDFDMGLIGFNASELESIMQIDVDFAPATEDEQGKLDELAPKYATCPNCNTTFDTRGND